MGKPRPQGKTSGGDDPGGAPGKDYLHRIKERSTFSPSSGKRGTLPGLGASSMVKTRKQKERRQMEEKQEEMFRNLRNNLTEELPDSEVGSTNGGAAEQSSVPVKIEEYRKNVDKVEKRIGNGSSDDEHNDVLLVIPPFHEVKNENMSDSEMPLEVNTEDTVDDVSHVEEEEPDNDDLNNQISNMAISEESSMMEADDYPLWRQDDDDALLDEDSMLMLLSSSEEEHLIEDIANGGEGGDDNDSDDKTSNRDMVAEENENEEAAPVPAIDPELLSVALPHVLKYLTKKELLNFREACKDWRGAVDFYLDNLPMYYPNSSDKTQKKKSRGVSFIGG